MAYHKNLGCYNNIIGWAACKEQTLISHSSGCWESEIKAVADSVSGGGSLPRSYMSLHCVLRWWRGRGNSLGLFLKGCLSCSRGFHPHDAIPSQRPRLQMPYGDSVSTWVWGWREHPVSTCPLGEREQQRLLCPYSCILDRQTPLLHPLQVTLRLDMAGEWKTIRRSHHCWLQRRFKDEEPHVHLHWHFWWTGKKHLRPMDKCGRLDRCSKRSGRLAADSAWCFQ